MIIIIIIINYNWLNWRKYPVKERWTDRVSKQNKGAESWEMSKLSRGETHTCSRWLLTAGGRNGTVVLKMLHRILLCHDQPRMASSQNSQQPMPKEQGRVAETKLLTFTSHNNPEEGFVVQRWLFKSSGDLMEIIMAQVQLGLRCSS